MIFHFPLPLVEEASSASGIRPGKMLNAFRSLGYEVEVISGYSAERKKAIKYVLRKIKEGYEYDFIYSEASTMPTLLTDPHHLPLHPFFDFSFFKYCKSIGINIGLFYRDIYWNFEGYKNKNGWFKSSVAKIFYRYDLVKYGRLVSKLYLPSSQMSEYVPHINSDVMEPLPPGHDGNEVNAKQNVKLQLIYVGGIGPSYKLHDLFKSVRNHPKVNLTICTRKFEWEKYKKEYIKYMSDNIQVVHKNHTGLQQLYNNADVAMLFVEQHEYRDFAVPYKFYEYIGYKLPVISSQGTLVSKIIEDYDIGWSMPYDAEHLGNLLNELIENRSVIESKVEKITAMRNLHTWKARAQKVVRDLTGKK